MTSNKDRKIFLERLELRYERRSVWDKRTKGNRGDSQRTRAEVDRR